MEEEEEEEPPGVEEVEAKEAAVVVAPAYVTVLVSPANKWSQESRFSSEKKKRDSFKLGCLYSCTENMFCRHAYSRQFRSLTLGFIVHLLTHSLPHRCPL